MSETILIVEDHAAVRHALREWLTAALPQYSFIEATNGEEALFMAQATSPRLVLMDIVLPRMNGIEATRRIKAALPATQIVMLSIHDSDAHRADALKAGASAYVPKRNMRTELLPTLAALLPSADEPAVESH